jgi:hypothetical protein
MRLGKKVTPVEIFPSSLLIPLEAPLSVQIVKLFHHGLRETEFSKEIEKLQNKSVLSPALLKKFTQSVILLENAIRPLLHIHTFIA